MRLFKPRSDAEVLRSMIYCTLAGVIIFVLDFVIAATLGRTAMGHRFMAPAMVPRLLPGMPLRPWLLASIVYWATAAAGSASTAMIIFGLLFSIPLAISEHFSHRLHQRDSNLRKAS